MKTETLDFKQFVKNEKFSSEELMKFLKDKKVRKLASVVGGLMLILIPKSAFAASQAVADQTFSNLWNALMNITDWLMLGCLCFAGISWMLGFRPRGIELLISSSCGYILCRHAIDIRDFLKKI